MTERPILFSAPMVRALLDGSKTQTRRVAKSVKHPDLGNMYDPGALVLEREPQHVIERACPYGQPGDRLWVRENWYQRGSWRKPAWPEAEWDDAYWDGSRAVEYAAEGEGKGTGWRSRPSIHMPRWASRILLEVVSVRVERLNAISADDCRAEGIGQCDGLGTNAEILDLARRMGTHTDEVLRYATLWEQINGAGSWDANPWVWVVEFKRVQP